jgi:ferredoxin
MARIHFAGADNFEREFPDGTLLQKAIDSSNADIMFGCREGSCATCMIEVLDGMANLNPPTDAEKTTLMPEELKANVRLACQCKVLQGKISIQAASGDL